VLENAISADGFPDRMGVLSGRERQVLELTATGMTNAEMAKQLCLSVYAVKFHLASIYRKLGVANRTEAAFALLSSDSGQAVEH
jgi:DNA-binding CsgD family transcriptional regulator